MIINLSQTLKKILKYSTIFFAKQLFLANTNSDLPSQFSKKAHKLLSTMHFTSDDILKIIKKSSNQSGFMPRDLYINQLLSITYEIYKS